MQFLVSNNFHKEQVFYLFGISFGKPIPKLKALVPEISPIIFERKAFIGFGEMGVFLKEPKAQGGESFLGYKKIISEVFSGSKQEAFQMAKQKEKLSGGVYFVGALENGKFILLGL